MRSYGRINRIFSRNRKALYVILGMTIISVLTLSVVYAALSTTLQINGNAEVLASSWDIHLDNIVLNNQSATKTKPTITSSTTATFSTELSKPGDYYEFTVDVVNDGTIDAVINSVTKTPELTTTQKKYLNYIVEYQNGEAITTEQLVLKKTSVRLKVRIEFRNDISASDLPATSETLNLSFKVNYVQSDENIENTTISNNGHLLNFISGDINTIGSEISIGDEHFYLVKNDGTKAILFAKYNLYIGYQIDQSTGIFEELSDPTGIQDSRALGSQWDENGKATNFPWRATLPFGDSSYWWDEETSTYKDSYQINAVESGVSRAYVYGQESNFYKDVENYKKYIEYQGINVEAARLIKLSELIELGCNVADGSCPTEYPWLFNTASWTGTAYDGTYVHCLTSAGLLARSARHLDYITGVRPVLEISLSQF